MKTTIELPLLPLRDVVVYPHMVIPLFVGREKSIEALEAAMTGDKQILLVAQKNPAVDDPDDQDLYRVGTVATVLQLLKLPDGTVKVLVEGEQRGSIERFIELDDHCRAEVQLIEEGETAERESEVFTRSLLSQFEQYVQLGKKVPAEVLSSLNSIDEPSRLVDTMAAHMALKIEQKQEILEITSLSARVEHVLALLDAEIDLLQVEKRIRGRVKKQMERSQREYYLNEQMKAIQKELGDIDEGHNEIDELKKRIDNAGLTKEALTKANAELNKLKQMSPMS
ncbi:MAG TPA: endopeptidase La, partial [Pseudomonas sp.]|nr:endopeptidase La [Pseudomonas sp.]